MLQKKISLQMDKYFGYHRFYFFKYRNDNLVGLVGCTEEARGVTAEDRVNSGSPLMKYLIYFNRYQSYRVKHSDFLEELETFIDQQNNRVNDYKKNILFWKEIMPVLKKVLKNLFYQFHKRQCSYNILSIILTFCFEAN